MTQKLHYSQVQEALLKKIESGDFNKGLRKDAVILSIINRNTNPVVSLEQAEMILCGLPSLSQDTLQAVVERFNLEIKND